jgi:hypothetical protein
MISPAEQRIAVACKSTLLQIQVAAIHGVRSLSYRAGYRPRVADGPVRFDQSSVEKRTEQGRPADVLNKTPYAPA